MKTFKIYETENGIIDSIELSSGEYFLDFNELREYAQENKETVYGEKVHNLVVGLKGAGERPRVLSFLRDGIVSKIKYKNLTMIDVSMWNMDIDADSESIAKVENIEKIYGKVIPTPSSAVNESFSKALTVTEMEKIKYNRPSILDAWLCSSKLPGREFRPAYTGGVLSSPADPTKVYREVRSYDINSSYPYSALAAKVPTSKSRELTKDQLSSIVIKDGKLNLPKNTGFIGLFRVNNFKRKSWVRIPTLRNSDKKYIHRIISDKLGPLAGSIDVALNPYELETFCLQYDYESIEIGSLSIHSLGYIPKYAENFIIDSFNKKNVLHKGDPRRDEAKTALNTIIGFWGIDPFSSIIKKKLLEGLVVNTVDGDLGQSFDNYAGTDEKFGHAAGKIRSWDFRWATYALAHARLRMARADEACFKAGLEVIYSDTDCIKVNGDEAVAEELFTELNVIAREEYNFDGIGLWEREGEEFTNGVFRAPKFYMLEDGEGNKDARIAGVKPIEAKAYLKNITPEELSNPDLTIEIEVTRRSPGTIQQALFGFNKVYALRTASINFK